MPCLGMAVAHMSYIVHTIKVFQFISAVQVAPPASNYVQRFAVEQGGVVSHKLPPLLQNCGSVSRLHLERTQYVQLMWAQTPSQEHNPQYSKSSGCLSLH